MSANVTSMLCLCRTKPVIGFRYKRCGQSSGKRGLSVFSFWVAERIVPRLGRGNGSLRWHTESWSLLGEQVKDSLQDQCQRARRTLGFQLPCSLRCTCESVCGELAGFLVRTKPKKQKTSGEREEWRKVYCYPVQRGRQ